MIYCLPILIYIYIYTHLNLGHQKKCYLVLASSSVERRVVAFVTASEANHFSPEAMTLSYPGVFLIDYSKIY